MVFMDSAFLIRDRALNVYKDYSKYVHFICAEESEKRELKGYNIIGYVSDI